MKRNHINTKDDIYQSLTSSTVKMDHTQTDDFINVLKSFKTTNKLNFFFERDLYFFSNINWNVVETFFNQEFEKCEYVFILKLKKKFNQLMTWEDMFKNVAELRKILNKFHVENIVRQVEHHLNNKQFEKINEIYFCLTEEKKTSRRLLKCLKKILYMTKGDEEFNTIYQLRSIYQDQDYFYKIEGSLYTFLNSYMDRFYKSDKPDNEKVLVFFKAHSIVNGLDNQKIYDECFKKLNESNKNLNISIHFFNIVKQNENIIVNEHELYKFLEKNEYIETIYTCKNIQVLQKYLETNLKKFPNSSHLEKILFDARYDTIAFNNLFKSLKLFEDAICKIIKSCGFYKFCSDCKFSLKFNFNFPIKTDEFNVLRNLPNHIINNEFYLSSLKQKIVEILSYPEDIFNLLAIVPRGAEGFSSYLKDIEKSKRLEIFTELYKSWNYKSSFNKFALRLDESWEYDEAFENVNCEEESEQCSVCFEKIRFKTTLTCNHSFCNDCIIYWVKLKKTCPYCRSAISHDDIRRFGFRFFNEEIKECFQNRFFRTGFLELYGMSLDLLGEYVNGVDEVD